METQVTFASSSRVAIVTPWSAPSLGIVMKPGTVNVTDTPPLLVTNEVSTLICGIMEDGGGAPAAWLNVLTGGWPNAPPDGEVAVIPNNPPG